MTQISDEDVQRAIDAYCATSSDNMRDMMRNALQSLRSKPVAGVEDDADEAYEIGKRDGYERAVQDIDRLTGGDGEYRYCSDHDPERHTPDADTMKARIADRFSTISIPAQEPAFYGVWSGKIWPDEKTAREIASEYDSPAVVPLYASPQSEAVITEETVERIATLYGNFIPGHGWTGFGPTPEQIESALEARNG